MSVLHESKLTVNTKKHSTSSLRIGDLQEEELLIKTPNIVNQSPGSCNKWKKVLACIMATDSPCKYNVKTGSPPCGMNHDDCLQCARQKMSLVISLSNNHMILLILQILVVLRILLLVSILTRNEAAAPKEIAGWKLCCLPWLCCLSPDGLDS